MDNDNLSILENILINENINELIINSINNIMN